MIKFIRNISPFNNQTEMPAGMLVVIIAVSAAVTGYMTVYKNRQED